MKQRKGEIPYQDLAGQLDIFGHELTEAEVTTQPTKATVKTRQADRIQAGYHPLGMGLLHRMAALPASVADGSHKTFSCGTCVHRNVVPGYEHPKCDFVPPIPTEDQSTDCLAWWPACRCYRQAG